MKVEVITREEALKRFGRRGTTISTISPAEFGRRLEEHATKLEEAEAKKKAEAEAKAQATPSPTEK
ncbi:MAG: hypothetical protein SOR95_05850 [Sutterella sp.]|nr:hypothetical protein [Sutterella sp.]